MTPQNINESRIIKKKGISLIWVLPIIAVLLAGWLVFDKVSRQGTMITILFDSATGLEPGKTKVKYKGIVAGVVKKVDLSEDFQSITATVEMIKDAEEALTDQTEFLLVKPEVSLSKISGLETLVSGEYISIIPSLEGKPARHFVALKNTPPPVENGQGLTLTLYSENARSIGIGSFVTYRELQVGEVYDYELSDNGKQVLIHIFIQKEYAHLIRKNTRFWNSSGIDINLSFHDVSVRTDSLFSLISGGISLYTPNEPETFPQAIDNDFFKLYEDFDAARQGISVSIKFDNAEGLGKSTPVLLNGVKVGSVESMEYDENYSGAVVQAMLDTGTETFLNTDTIFWLVKPEMTLNGPRGMDAIIKGNYIAMKPGKGDPARQFTASSSEPVDHCNEKGLMLCLKSDTLTVHEGAPVYYRKVPVGEVSRYSLDDNGKSVKIQLRILEEFAHLVTSGSRFYSTGGVRINTGPKGLKVETDNILSAALGGISFFTPQTLKPKKNSSDECPCYPLYKNLSEASGNGKLLMAEDTNSLFITVTDDHSTGVMPGSPVLYKKMDVGEVLFSELSPGENSVRVHLKIRPEHKSLVKKNSRFWNSSGIDINASMSGFSLHTDSLTSIAFGGISFYTPSDEAALAAENNDSFSLHADYQSAANLSRILTITFPSAEGLTYGAPLTYKGIQLGQVTKTELNPDHESVNVIIELYDSGRFVAREKSRFWVVKPVLGITGAKNIKTIITGNYLSVLPGDGEETFSFAGMTTPPGLSETTDGMDIQLVSKDLGSLSIGCPVYYKQIPVGKITHYELDQENDQVLITANIDTKYSGLVRNKSRFWNVSGVDLGFGLFSGLQMETRPAAAIMLGGVSFTTPGGAKAGEPAASGERFTLHEAYNKKWAKH